MEPSRIEAYLRATCSVLDFDIGELWCAKKDKDNKLSLKFMQLYTSPTYKDFHSLLIQPEKVPNYSSENIKEHRFSPIICRSVCDGCQIVWANTRISGGLTGRSDLPLNTAVGIPVCSIAQDLYILVLFAVGMVHMTHNSVEYLLSVVRAVTMNGGGFLSASLKLSVTAPFTNDFVGQWDIADLIKKYSQDVDFKLIPINTLQNYLDCHEILLFCDLFLDFKLTRNGTFTERQLESLREASKSTTNAITSAKLRSDSISSDAWGNDYIYDNDSNISIPSYKAQNFPSFLKNSYNQQDISSNMYGVYCAQNLNNKDNCNNSKYQNTEFNNNNKDHTKPLNDSISHLYSHVTYKISQSRYHEFMIAILGMTVFSSAELWVLAEDRSSLFLMAAVYRSSVMQKWIAISENIRMNINCNDIVTSILQNNSFLWDPDFYLSNDRSTGPRAKLAKPLGINTAFGVPVPGINGVFGCMVFYSNKVNLDLDPLIIQVLEKAVQIMSNTAQESLSSQVSLDHKNKLSTMKLKSENPSYYHPISKLESISNLDKMITISSNSNISGSNSNILEQSLDFNQRLQLCRSIFISKKNLIEINQSTSFASALANSVKIYNEKLKSMNIIDGSSGCETNSSKNNNNNNQCNDNYNEEHVGLYINDSDIGFLLENKISKGSDVSVIVYDDSSFNRSNSLINSTNDDSLLSVDSVFDAAEALASFGRFQWNASNIDSFDSVLMNNELSISSVESKLDKKRKLPEEEFNNKPMIKNTVEFHNSSQALNQCKSDGCQAFVENENFIYCIEHRSIRRCQYDGCIKCAQGATKYCISHGGGRRCTFPNCFKGARDKFYCAAHGGGKRCCFEGGCSKSAVGGSDLCTAHGGGKRCKFEGCMKSSQSSTDYCVKHGGGKSCVYIGCNKVARGKTDLCAAHGGGVRCISNGCMKLAVGALHLCRIHNTEAKHNKIK